MNYLQRKILTAQIGTKNTITKVQTLLKNKDGLSTSTEILLWVLLGAVIVGIIGGLAIALIKSDIFPALSTKVKDILNL